MSHPPRLLKILVVIAAAALALVHGGIVGDIVATDGATSVDAAADDVWASGGTNVGLYVWTAPRAAFDPEIASHRDRLVRVVASRRRPIRFVYLSAYRSGGHGHMHNAAALADLVSRLHSHGVKVFALFTELNLSAPSSWNFFARVAEYNRARPRSAERFDGLAMNWEGVVDGKAPATDAAHWRGMYAAAKRAGLPLHNAMRHWWDAANVGTDMFRVIIDNSDAVNVMAYSAACHAATFVREELAYARAAGKPLYVALETMALGTRGGAVRGETFAPGGEDALVACMGTTARAVPAAAGFVVHYYGDLYASGKPGWPAHDQ
jgi:hypothetical protein